MTDVVARMTWDRIVPWKVLSLAVRGEAALEPVAYGYSDFPNELGRGSRLWVVTRRSRREPYTLLGKLEVERVCPSGELRGKWPSEADGLLRRWKKLAVAREGSGRFFQTNDADSDLRALGIRFYGPFRYIRNPVRPFASAMRQSRRTVFVSYKWKEEKEFALELASALRAEAFSPWFDALAIPAFDEKRDREIEPRLDELIRRGIDDSDLAVVVNSPSYRENGYTKMEWEHILRRGIRRLQVMREGQELPDTEVIGDGTPAEVAAAIRRALDRAPRDRRRQRRGRGPRAVGPAEGAVRHR